MRAHLTMQLTMASLACSILFAISPACHPVRAAGLWYVAPGGSDANTCSAPGAACASINGALNKSDFLAGDTVLVAAGVYTGAGEQVILLDRNAALSGGWDTDFTKQSGTSTIDGQGARRGMTVAPGSVATVEHFNFNNASTRGVFSSGILTLSDCDISGNDGGVYNDSGTLAVNHSRITNNITGADGAGIANANGTAVIEDSLIGDNVMYSPGSSGGGGGAGIQNHNSGSLVIKNSTISNNRIVGGFHGSAIHSGGYVTVSIINSTISGNTGGSGSSVYGFVSQYDISNSTIASNVGGLVNVAGTVRLRNTLLADNTERDCYNDTAYGGAVQSDGYNLIGRQVGCLTSTTDLIGVDPKLEPLEAVGAALPTHALLFDSPAVNSGNPSGCTDQSGNSLPKDERGAPRFGRCDIGAYELQPLGFSTLTVDRATALPGDAPNYTITLNNGGSTDITNVQVTDTLPASLSYVEDSLTVTGGSAEYSDGVITWNGIVNAGGTVAITYKATVPLNLGRIVNSAVIKGGGEIFTRTATVTVDGPICNLTKYDGNPVLTVGADGSWDDDAVWGPAVLKEVSSYKMWYTGTDGSNPSRIGLATSSDATTWTKAATNPVLSPGDEWWEIKGIRVGSVIFDDGLYKMWFAGFDIDGVSRIGYATSPDGVTWTKYGGNPVLNVGNFGSFEESGVEKPTVFKEDSTYHLWYTGSDGMTQRIGHTASSDGINWTKDPVNPVLEVGSPGAWDWLHVYGPSVVKVGAEYKLWYSGQTLPAAWQVGYARSSDGSAWTREKMLISEGLPGTFDAASADYPSVLVDGDKYRVWYSGLNNSGDHTIGYATAKVCRGAGAPSGRPIYLPLVVKSPQVLCQAYYIDNFGDPASGWPVADDSSHRYAYTGGEYQIWVKNPREGWSVTPGAKVTDFAAAVSARRTSGTLGAYGIQFGINSQWNQLYEFIVENASYSIWRYDNGNWTALKTWTFSHHIRTGKEWNRLKVIRNGVSISVYVNDQFLTTVGDNYPTGLRWIGLVAYSPKGSGMDARFDDFSLSPAICGTGGAGASGVAFQMGEPGGYEAPVPPGLGQVR
jgi:uncharacterized repeat protein (TIGR01451 family)